ncbi:neutral zinc metallopeptidase [Agromyces tardus]|jgi:predicted metalloprotease|uniref:Neutral zinc metallopeptidase n=1 Tax=Agromyces tardus TaxID=2583849 RepID=A0A3M8AET5_9MICO|nr:neutral zinc metallopeptidase [Agromyces tardus]RNB49723.1 neutral zinc metallopeptidase [Agromyces tardus]
MTFNPNSDIGGGKTSRRGRTTGIAVGGGLGVLALFLLSQFLGVDLTGLAGGGGGEPAASDSALEECQTGQDANERVDCRMKGAAASLEAYWQQEAPAIGVDYVSPQDFVLFSQAVSTGCGQASSATGPFYCPPDQTLYVDTSFFDQLEQQFGANDSPLAEMYVVAHEWGHHVQNLAGILAQTQDGQTGPTSNSVRAELQADCFAGAWAGAASQTPDQNGVPFLQPITQQQYSDAIGAAAAVGDDRIQEATQGQVTPHSFTHGTSEQRVRWFQTGYEQGAGACDTFGVDGGSL